MRFSALDLDAALIKAVEAAGYTEVTPIQQKAIPPILRGRDLVGCAQTGTGKTAAFAIPLLQRLLDSADAHTGAARRRRRSGRRVIRGLVLAPTRELTEQIGDSFARYGKFLRFKQVTIYGGVSQASQVQKLKAGVDLIIATPGRLLDLSQQQQLQLSAVEILVLDEADQMLDLGFQHDLRKIITTTPIERQTIMFSATMPPAVRQLADRWLRRPSEIRVSPVASVPSQVNQWGCFVEPTEKLSLLEQILKARIAAGRTLVFVRTKRDADRLTDALTQASIPAGSIHGDKTQAERHAALRGFRSAEAAILVATDVAARGLDIPSVTLVVNFELPRTTETYVHRIGRTARAGAGGSAISFCSETEKERLKQVEQLIGERIAVISATDLVSTLASPRITGGHRKPNRRAP